MQLVMRGYRLEGALWYNFRINARLVIDKEQESLLDKYRLHKVTITPGDIRRDIIRALLITVPGSLFLMAFLFAGGLGGSPGPVFILILVASTFFVYQQIREEVRVNDLLTAATLKRAVSSTFSAKRQRSAKCLSLLPMLWTKRVPGMSRR